MSVSPDVLISTNNVEVKVKDPEEAGIFSEYIRVPGVGTIGLPNDPANPNEIVTFKGIASAPSFQRLGNATISLPQYIGYHPVMAMLRKKRDASKKVLAEISIPGETVITTDANVAGENTGIFTPVKDAIEEITNLLLVGHAFTIGAGNAAKTYIVYEITRDDNTGKLQTFKAATVEGEHPANAIAGTPITLKVPTQTFLGISATVSGLADGQFETESAVSSELTLTPQGRIGTPTLS